jgi:hypothetical protein
MSAVGRKFKGRPGSSGFYDVLDDVSAGVDFMAIGPNADPAKNDTMPWKFIVLGAGDLILIRPDGEEITIPAPENLLLEDTDAIGIAAGSTATNVLVFW